MKAASFAIGSLICCLLVSCASGVDDAPSEPRQPLPALGWVETASIGGATAEGVYALGSVRSAALLSDPERIAVADGLTRQIHVFDTIGGFVGTVGGRGSGPGEFQALRTIAAREGGGLCAWDVQLARVTELDASGIAVRTAAVDLSAMEGIRPDFVGFQPDCSFVLRDKLMEMALRNEPGGMRTDPIRFAGFDSSGQLRGILATTPDAEEWFRNGGRSWGRMPLVFGEQLIAFLFNDRLWYGPSDSLQWARLDLATGPGDTLRFDSRSRAASVADIEAERQRRLAEVRSDRVEMTADGVDIADQLAEWKREGIRTVPARTHFPLYDRAVPGPSDVVWLRLYPEPRDTVARWALLDPEQGLMGEVVFDRSEEILAASRTWLVVLTTDEFDAPVVRVVRVTETR